MTSGAWITASLFGYVLILFPAWELTQLYRRRRGNKSARTASQWIIKQVADGSKFWLFVSIAFPILLFFVSIWLLAHWMGLCFWKGWLCDIGRRL